MLNPPHTRIEVDTARALGHCERRAERRHLVGRTKYTAGTSGMGWRSLSSSRCNVTPWRRRSFTFNSGAMRSRVCLSSTSTCVPQCPRLRQQCADPNPTLDGLSC